MTEESKKSTSLKAVNREIEGCPSLVCQISGVARATVFMEEEFCGESVALYGSSTA